MMDCKEIRQRLQGFLSGECPPEAEEAALNHLAGCPECMDLLIETAQESGSAQRFLATTGLLDGPGRDCPTPEELSAYVAVACDAADAQRVARHAQRCAFCAGELKELLEFHEVMSVSEPVAHAPAAHSLGSRLRDLFWGTSLRRRAMVAGPAAAVLVLAAAFTVITLSKGPDPSEVLAALAPQVEELLENGIVERAPAVQSIAATRSGAMRRLLQWDADRDSYVLRMDFSGSGWHPRRVDCAVWDVSELEDGVRPESVIGSDLPQAADPAVALEVQNDRLEWRVPLDPGRIYLWLIKERDAEDQGDGGDGHSEAVLVATDIRYIFGAQPSEEHLLILIAFYEWAGFDNKASHNIQLLRKLNPDRAERYKSALENRP